MQAIFYTTILPVTALNLNFKNYLQIYLICIYEKTGVYTPIFSYINCFIIYTSGSQLYNIENKMYVPAPSGLRSHVHESLKTVNYKLCENFENFVNSLFNSLVHPGQSGNPAPGRYYRSGEVFRILIKI